MDISVTEMQYPIDFRAHDAKMLGSYLQHRQSVQLVGMKRVGISNFLRFFLYNKNIKSKYLPSDGKNLFIPVDLNNLIEREIFPFWRLTFKRLVDTVENSLLDSKLKQKISDVFDSSIQSGDVFLTFDGVRESLAELVKANIYPTIFFLRFDRLASVVTPEFLNNLQSLQDSTNQKLTYVFTSYRELDALAPETFSKQILSSFAASMYLLPAKVNDVEVLFASAAGKYNLSVPEPLRRLIIGVSGGHAQYVQLSLVVLHELSERQKVLSEEEVLAAIESDERVMLQSEELWESLTHEEQDLVRHINDGKKINEADREQGRYLWNTGFVVESNGMQALFSPLFALFVETNKKKKIRDGLPIEFSKKEHMLFETLQQYPNEVVEREKIVELVWPEYKEYGVSDWSVDRLVARVRGKLRKQNNGLEIITVRTRGYKLIKK